MTWFLFRTAPKAERKICALCHERGIRSFVPVERKYGRRGPNRLRTEIILPMFPRYLFAEFHDFAADYYTMRSIRGVQGIVGVNHQPSPISDATMERVFQMPKSVPTSSTPIRRGFTAGDKVRICSGAFADYVVEVTSIKGRHAMVLQKILGSERIIKVDLSELEAA